MSFSSSLELLILKLSFLNTIIISVTYIFNLKKTFMSYLAVRKLGMWCLVIEFGKHICQVSQVLKFSNIRKINICVKL